MLPVHNNSQRNCEGEINNANSKIGARRQECQTASTNSTSANNDSAKEEDSVKELSTNIQRALKELHKLTNEIQNKKPVDPSTISTDAASSPQLRSVEKIKKTASARWISA